MLTIRFYPFLLFKASAVLTVYVRIIQPKEEEIP